MEEEAHHFEIREKSRIEKYTNDIVNQLTKLEMKGKKQVVEDRLQMKLNVEEELHQSHSSKKKDDSSSMEKNLPKFDLNDPKTDPWALINIM